MFQSLNLKSAVLQGQSGDISSERFCRPVMWLNQPRRHVTELRVRLSLVLHPRPSLMFHLLCLMHDLFAFAEKPHAYLPKARQFQIKGRSQLLCPYGIWALLITFILTCHVRINDSEMRLTLTPNCWKKKKQKTHLISNENDNLSPSAHQNQQDRWHLCHGVNLPPAHLPKAPF